MSFKQKKLTKVKSHCSQVNVLSKICTKKQSETEFHIKAYTRLTHYKKATNRNAVDDMLKPASHREPIQHEDLQKLLWQKPSPTGLVQPCLELLSTQQHEPLPPSIQPIFSY
jgi:hypothetical protein